MENWGDDWFSLHCYHCSRSWEDITLNGPTSGCLCDPRVAARPFKLPHKYNITEVLFITAGIILVIAFVVIMTWPQK